MFLWVWLCNKRFVVAFNEFEMKSTTEIRWCRLTLNERCIKYWREEISAYFQINEPLNRPLNAKIRNLNIPPIEFRLYSEWTCRIEFVLILSSFHCHILINREKQFFHILLRSRNVFCLTNFMKKKTDFTKYLQLLCLVLIILNFLLLCLILLWLGRIWVILWVVNWICNWKEDVIE